MERREKTKEEEEELDRKIAQIREKNLKIVARSREIEEDRVNSTDGHPKPVSKTNSESSNGRKSGEWSREWDQGKTSADTWRENVPSIEHSSRLAGRGGRGSSNNNQRQKHQHETAPFKPKSGRLEGRVTQVNDNAKTRDNASRGRGSRGGRGGQTRGPREVHGNGNELKISIKNNDNQQKQQHQPAKKKEQQQGNKENVQKEHKKRPENDKFVCKTVMRKIVDKIEYLERCERRKLKQEAEASKNGSQQSPALSDRPEEVDCEDKDHHEEEEEEEHQEEDKEEEKVEEKKEENKETPKEKSPTPQPEATSDANQNVITLAKEKVLTMEIST